MGINIQDSTKTAVDTLTTSYSGKWDGVEGIEQSSGFIQMMASNDLIFVVLGVSLIIWFVLLFYLIRVDRKVGKLEKSLKEESDEA
ncbi:CcmD family protein [Rhodohalobacter sp. 614A]|uniref:CcmD family protein n=1 Tax=Rhodohalobacter sp. 614A TaxID=2908649 RepID=UPI001F3DBD48|nr:hypothetical protein [Rhodohalobacter sp. 614A]